MKKGRLTKEEIVYIQQNGNQDAEVIAKKLDRSVKSVEKHLTPDVVTEETAESLAEEKGALVDVFEPGKNKMRNLIGRKTAGGNRGSTFMTGEASSLSDDTAAKRKTGKSRYSDTAVHKPYGDE